MSRPGSRFRHGEAGLHLAPGERRQEPLLLLRRAEVHHWRKPEDVHVNRRCRCLSAAAGRDDAQEQRRFGDAEVGAAVLLGHADAEPAAGGHRIEEGMRKLVVAILLQPVVEREPGADRLPAAATIARCSALSWKSMPSPIRAHCAFDRHMPAGGAGLQSHGRRTTVKATPAGSGAAALLIAMADGMSCMVSRDGGRRSLAALRPRVRDRAMTIRTSAGLFHVVTVKDDERGFLMRDGCFERLLEPGRFRSLDIGGHLASEVLTVVRAEFPPSARCCSRRRSRTSPPDIS